MHYFAGVGYCAYLYKKNFKTQTGDTNINIAEHLFFRSDISDSIVSEYLAKELSRLSERNQTMQVTDEGHHRNFDTS